MARVRTKDMATVSTAAVAAEEEVGAAAARMAADADADPGRIAATVPR